MRQAAVERSRKEAEEEKAKKREARAQRELPFKVGQGAEGAISKRIGRARKRTQASNARLL